MKKLVWILSGLLAASAADAATINVSGGGRNLQTAINNAYEGDVLRVASGTYWPIVSSNKAIRIEATGSAATTVIDGGHTNRCATLGSSMGFAYHTNTVLVGFTLRNGEANHAGVTVAQNFGGGSFWGTLVNCTLSDNNARYGGGAFRGTLENCEIFRNTAFHSIGDGDGSGGGAMSCQLSHCRISGNLAQADGGGTDGGTLNHCTLTGNEAGRNGGGVYAGTLRNCLLTGNMAGENGGGAYLGTFFNCTLSGNTADSNGGGAYYSTLNNCIVWGNTAPAGANHSGNCTFSYSCTTPNPGGTGNIYQNPSFVSPANGDYRLQSGSLCIDAGSNGYVTWAFDLDGNRRIWGERVDMGAYERDASPAATVFYVDALRPNDTGNGRSWATAKRTLQAAVDLAMVAGDTVVVTNGTYAPISTGNRAITIQSVNGRYATTITGGLANRCATLGDPDITFPLPATNTVLTGFTLTAGRAECGGGVMGGTLNDCSFSFNTADSGGGACDSVLNRCELSLNYAYWDGGGACRSTLNDCSVSFNTASLGGGTADCDLYDCTLSYNKASQWGGGAMSWVGSRLVNCTLSYNTASGDGGGVACCDLYGCTLTGNAAGYNDDGEGGHFYDGGGGGAITCYLFNCTVSGNNAGDGGGAYDCVLEGCTLSDNIAGYNDDGSDGLYYTVCGIGGGACESELRNCIVSGNWAGDGGGAWDCVLEGCSLSLNFVWGNGGGVAGESTLRNCMLAGNQAGDGGGALSSTLTGCTLSGNRAHEGGGACDCVLEGCILSANVSYESGGGVSYGTLRNCLLAGNSAYDGGGAYECELTGCTLSGNVAYDLKGDVSPDGVGGASNCTLENCIVWGNLDHAGGQGNHESCTFYSSCTFPNPGGSNIGVAPLFRADLRLMPGSSGIDAGSNAYVLPGEKDILGNNRIQGTRVDMGAYEGEWLVRSAAGSVPQNVQASQGVSYAIRVSWTPPASGGAVAYLVFRTDLRTGARGPISGWLSGTEFIDTCVLDLGEYAYAVVAAFDATAYEISALSDAATGWAEPPVYYVDDVHGDDANWGDSWASAKKTIQSALDDSYQMTINFSIPLYHGTRIIVTNGVYEAFTTGDQTFITIESVEGAGVTIIDGGNTNRCAMLGTSAARTNNVLSGFTLRRGNADHPNVTDGNGSGGGAMGGTLMGCVLTNNVAMRGGGAYLSAMTDCVLSGNSAGSTGGGTYGGTQRDCVLSGNTALGAGGGTYVGTLVNCTLTNNWAVLGGASAQGGLVGCVLVDNEAENEGGGAYYGALEDCTLAGNKAWDGGGAWAAILENCVLTNNTAWEMGGGAYAGKLRNCVLTGNTSLQDAGAGAHGGTLYNCLLTGNTAANNGGGACNATLVNCTLAGNSAWSSGGTYGCTLANCIVWGNTAGNGNGTSNYAASCTLAYSCAGPRPGGTGNTGSDPLFADAAHGDFRLLAGSPCIDTGDDTCVTWGFDLDGRERIIRAHVDMGAYEWDGGVVGPAATVFYVNANRSDDTGDGASWRTAKKTLQAAIDIPSAAEIFVADGSYAPITTGNKAITIRSVNGAGATIIDGGNADRCATLGSLSTHADTVLDGFTLQNGDITGNGGGAYCGTLYNCILAGNVASQNGGGAYFGILNHCEVIGNFAGRYGGGAFQATANNCLFYDNAADDLGGGANNCTLVNCTLARNAAANYSGGMHYGTANNCIVWGNTVNSGDVSSNYMALVMNHSCSVPQPNGTGNITADPLFADAVHGDFRLLAGSPCIDTGNGGYVTWDLDLDGNRRVWGSRVDMGAYEFGAAPGGDSGVGATSLLITAIHVLPAAPVGPPMQDIVLDFTYYGGFLDATTVRARMWPDLADLGAFSFPFCLLNDHGSGTATLTVPVPADLPKAFFRIEAP